MSNISPNELYPMLPYQGIRFVKNEILRSNVVVGDYTYVDEANLSLKFEDSNVLYHYAFSKEKLIIGKFCAIAKDVKFIMASANHKLNGFSTYPFFIFGKEWSLDKTQEDGYIIAQDGSVSLVENKGDTVIGNDVWFGTNSTILPGIKIGNGAIIAANAIVTKDVPSYAVVAGNPAKIIKMRFDDKTIESLEQVKWWDWNIAKITRNIKYITLANLEKLQQCI